MMPKETVFWPMIALAALELLVGNIVGWRGMGLLGGLHAIILLCVLHLGKGLCGAQPFEQWHMG